MNKWQSLLSELFEFGFTQYEIAKYVGCSQSTINALSKGHRGKFLSFQIGEGIIMMLEKAKNRELVPQKTLGKSNV